MSGLRKKLRIKETIKETKETKSYILESPEGNDPDYKAGQFLAYIFDRPFGEQRG